MRELTVVKSLSTVCLIEAFVLTEFKATDIWQYLVAVFVSTAIASYASYSLREKWILRYIPTVLPGVAVFCTDILPMQVYVAVVVIYLMMVAYGETYDMEYHSYRRVYFAQLVVAAGLMILFMFLVSFYQESNRADPYVILSAHVLLGSYVLHQLRLGMAADRMSRLVNLVGLMCGVGIMGFLAKQLTRLDVIPWIKIAKNGFLIFGLILRFFVEGIVFIKEWAYDCYMHCECKITGKPYPRETGKTYIWNETELTSQLKEIDPVTGRVIVGVLIVVVVAVVLYFLIPQFDFGRVKHNIFKLNKKSFAIEGLSDRERFFVREKGKRGKMRGYYRQYLQYVRKIGFSVKPEDTSEDILKRVDLHEEKNAKARALRELYIKTRYCEEYEPTAQELQAAKAILKALK